MWCSRTLHPASMTYDIGWIIPRLRNPGRLWSAASSLTVAVVGLFSKLVIELLNKTTVYNREALLAAVRRPAGVPLITVSNHHSCFDDPGLWGVLDLVTLVRGPRMRWSLAAHDICFTSALHAYFFALGKCVPVVRGAGVYQPAIEFCIERLKLGEWVHIFPEGRVNVEQEELRYKWGVGRLVARAHHLARAPLVLPVWHEGMDQVLPNTEPYLLKFRKRVFCHVGEPIELSSLVETLRKQGASEEETRRALTARVQDELHALRDRTHELLRRTGAGRFLKQQADVTSETGSLASHRSTDSTDSGVSVTGGLSAHSDSAPDTVTHANGVASKQKDKDV